LSKPTKRWSAVSHEEPVNKTRVGLYERLMQAQEKIAHARYGRGVAHEAVLAAMDAAETGPSESERREDLYLSSLSAYVEALGGRLEIRAVFPEEAIVVEGERS
jgi:hypothetical protein